MSEQLIDTHFPGQQFPVGSVVTFLDRHRRAVLGTVTELRRHEAIVAAGEAGRWRVGYAGLQLVKAGPTGGADDAASRGSRCATARTATSTRPPQRRGGASASRPPRAAPASAGNTTRTIALSVSYALRAPWGDIRDTLLTRSHTRSSGPTILTRRHVADGASAARRSAPAQSRTA